ncbi:MAG: right-handed parallel beta-helix repeat-containing protein [Planctomycetota bacterium]|jgi:hypothetical protein
MTEPVQPTVGDKGPPRTRKALVLWLVIVIAPFACLMASWCLVTWVRSRRPPGSWEAEAWPIAPAALTPARTVEADPETFEIILGKARPGDLVLLADGEYTPALAVGCRGEKGRPVTLRARGTSAVFSETLKVTGAEWFVIDGLTFDFKKHEGERFPYYGIHMTNSAYCVIRNCVIRNIPGRYGIYSTDISTTVFENNDLSLVQAGHGLCVFGASKDVIVRGNYVHDNAGCGIYLDAYTSPGSFLSGLLVEGNVVARNGTVGGAAFNCTNVLDSLFRNNLAYRNHAGGMCFFLSGEDQMNAALTQSEPRGLKERLLDWFYNRPSPDCARNTVVGNTVYFEPGQGRWSLKLRDKCNGFTVYNNIFFGGNHGTVSVAATSFDGLYMDYNLITTHEGQTLFGETFKDDNEASFQYTSDQWRAKGLDRHSIVNTDPAFISISDDDYRLAPGSPAIDAGKTDRRRCPNDIAGARRPYGWRFDCGAYEHKGSRPDE